ncbi:hypothetical protein C7B80_32325 [Cyanosarcina cf. burmensis CCALA 770]|nr:hypothetical protein C7B80_32325 [Cyanosarcina cf. burmensis CCALA 770]
MPEGHYHFRAKVISRSQGRAICAAAAYRSAEKIHDERYGKTFDYTPRTSIHATEIRAPAHAPDWMKDRSQLWNGVEAFETRKNSQLAREFEVSVPQELTAEQRKQAVRQFVDSELVSRGMVADVAYHDFTGKHSHNPHAHILVTMREIDGESFARKKNREWNTEETLVAWREAWAKQVNHALEQAKSQTRVDHRTYRERGIMKTPVSESQGEWHQRQKEIAAAKRHLEQTNRELAALEKEQKQARQERMDTITRMGADIARTHAVQQQQARLAQAAREAFELGQKLAREQQTHQQPQPAKPEPEPQHPDRSAKPVRNRGVEPWKRDWEKQQAEQRQQRTTSRKEQERKASIQRSEATRQEKPQQQSQPPLQPPAPSQDERALIEQWKQYHDRERDKPRVEGQQHDQPTRAAPGQVTPEQQAAKLKERMAEFKAEVEKLEQNQHHQPPRRKREPPPPEPPPEQRHGRGISM